MGPEGCGGISRTENSLEAGVCGELREMSPWGDGEDSSPASVVSGSFHRRPSRVCLRAERESLWTTPRRGERCLWTGAGRLGGSRRGAAGEGLPRREGPVGGPAGAEQEGFSPPTPAPAPDHLSPAPEETGPEMDRTSPILQPTPSTSCQLHAVPRLQPWGHSRRQSRAG